MPAYWRSWLAFREPTAIENFFRQKFLSNKKIFGWQCFDVGVATKDQQNLFAECGGLKLLKLVHVSGNETFELIEASVGLLLNIMHR